MPSTLASAALSGISVQAWFGRFDLLAALGRWRELTSMGVEVGLWEVESKVLKEAAEGRMFPGVEFSGTVRGARHWVVATSKPEGTRTSKQKLFPEVG